MDRTLAVDDDDGNNDSNDDTFPVHHFRFSSKTIAGLHIKKRVVLQPSQNSLLLQPWILLSQVFYLHSYRTSPTFSSLPRSLIKRVKISQKKKKKKKKYKIWQLLTPKEQNKRVSESFSNQLLPPSSLTPSLPSLPSDPHSIVLCFSSKSASFHKLISFFFILFYF